MEYLYQWVPVDFYDPRCECAEYEEVDEEDSRDPESEFFSFFWKKYIPPCRCDPEGAQDIWCKAHDSCVFCSDYQEVEEEEEKMEKDKVKEEDEESTPA